MKIKLLEDLPIRESHGATEGKVFEVTREVAPGEDAYGGRVFFIGEDGEECAALYSECEIIEVDDDED